MYQPTTDLAGEVCFRPNFWQTKKRINYLIDQYLSLKQLSDRLSDLPQQFKHPQARQWSRINWQEINSEQVIGIDFDIFLAIIQGALDTEAPIRGYTQTSRQYLEPIHPRWFTPCRHRIWCNLLVSLADVSHYPNNSTIIGGTITRRN